MEVTSSAWTSTSFSFQQPQLHAQSRLLHLLVNQNIRHRLSLKDKVISLLSITSISAKGKLLLTAPLPTTRSCYLFPLQNLLAPTGETGFFTCTERAVSNSLPPSWQSVCKLHMSSVHHVYYFIRIV